MRKNILIVENEPRNLKLVKDLLQLFEYDTMIAHDGKEAVEIAKNNYEKIDLILMDLQMPIMDGLTATKILKEDENTKNIKIIAVTAFAMAEDEERAMEAGCDGYITKPINITNFRETISLYLESDESSE